MLVLAIAVLAAAVIPLLTRGSYKRLLRIEIHWGWLLAAGLVIQLGLEYITMPREYWHSVGFGLLVSSYVLILAFCARNLVLRGMGIVFIGIACNALVIGLNQGMPVKLPPEWRDQSWAQATVKHHPRDQSDRLVFLSDIIVLKHPYDTVMSFGDLILAVGLCDVAYNASRNPRKRRKKQKRDPEPSSRTAANDYISKSGIMGPENEDAPLEPIYVAREPDPRAEAHDVWFDPADDMFSSRSRTSRR
jgi:hypothetical protein